MWIVNIFKPKVIVELGVDYAHSTFALSSELNHDGVIYGIDCFEGDVQAGKRTTLEIVNETYNNLLDNKLLKYDNVKFFFYYTLINYDFAFENCLFKVY